MTQHETPRGTAEHVEPARDEPIERAEHAEPAEHVEQVERAQPRATLLEQLGGLSGLVASTLPVLVFVPVNSIAGLNPAIGSALGVALAVTIWRLLRREPVSPALSGLLGVAVAAFIAHRTGSAKGYFLFGIWASLLYGGVFLTSVLVRWPLVGVIWHGINGHGQAWRADRRARIGYDVATLTWVAVFAARFVLQKYLYDQDSETWLGVARIAMGYPLTALALLVTVWAVRRARTGAEAVRHPAAPGATSTADS